MCVKTPCDVIVCLQAPGDDYDMTDLERLSAFLAKHNLGETLDILKEMRITSLPLFKMLFEDTEAGGMLEVFKTKLEAAKIPFWKKSLAAVTPEIVGEAIKEAATPTPEEDASKLKSYLEGATLPVKELAAFLATRGIRRLTFLTVLLAEGIDSLEGLKAVKSDVDRLSVLMTAIRQSEHQLKLETKALERASAADIDKAIEAAKADRESADAQELEAFLKSTTDEMKALAAFLKKNSLGRLAIVKVLKAEGVDSLERLKAAKGNTAKWTSLGAKIEAAGGTMARTFFDGLTAWAISAAIDEARQPSPEQAAARRKSMQDAIEGVEKLRKELHDLTKEKFVENKERLEKEYADIVNQLARYDLAFGAAEKMSGRDALDALFQATIDGVRKTKELLEGVEKEPRTLTDAIRRGDMLKGYLIRPGGIERKNADLIQMPELTADMRRDAGPYRSETFTYKFSSRTSFAVSSASKLGTNLAVGGQASGSGFIGSGIAAVSVVAS